MRQRRREIVTDICRIGVFYKPVLVLGDLSPIFSGAKMKIYNGTYWDLFSRKNLRDATRKMRKIVIDIHVSVVGVNLIGRC